VIAASALIARRYHPAPVKPEPLNIPGDVGPRVTVEVINTIPVDGLARDVTARLRRVGLDVVSFGSGGEALSVTQILVRRGDSTAGLRVRRALGVGKVRIVPDAALLLDVSVLVGADLPGALKLHP
jgi:hypothetical protein